MKIVKKNIEGKEVYVRIADDSTETVVALTDLTSDEKKSLGIDEQVSLAELEKLRIANVKLKNKYDTLLANSKTDDSETEALRLKLKEAEEYRTAMEKKLEEEALAKKSEFEKSEYLLQKEIKKLQEANVEMANKLKEAMDLLGKKDQEFSVKNKEIREVSLRTKLQALATKYNAYNAVQVAELIINKFVWDETSGDFVVQVRDNKGKLVDEKDPETFVKEFLSLKENDNLVKIEFRAGSGQPQESNLPASFTPLLTTPSNDKTIVITDKIKKAAALQGMTVDDYILVLKYQEAARNRNRENKKS